MWKRYSRFLDLRSELSDKVPPVKDLPFPKKKLKKKKDSVGVCPASRMLSCCNPLAMLQRLKSCTCDICTQVVEERRTGLQEFLQLLMLGDHPMVTPGLHEDVGKVLYTFLTGESDL